MLAWHLLKKVCSMSEDFSLARKICSTVLTDCLVWFCGLILSGCLQDDLVPMSIHVLYQQDQMWVMQEGITSKYNWKLKLKTEKQTEGATVFCKYTDDIELVYISCILPSHHSVFPELQHFSSLKAIESLKRCRERCRVLSTVSVLS